jgi:biotin carboxyl carrier protein
VAISTLQARFDDSAVTLVVQPDGRITIEDASFTVETIEPGVYRVGDGTRRWTVAVAGPPDERWISIDGQTSVVEISAGGSSRKKTRGGGQDLMTAPMPATVVKVLVEPGGHVAEGDTLIVLEAMKMELAVRAPRAGVISKVHCQVGELVQPGVALLELEP